jgi:hypothetical protein
MSIFEKVSEADMRFFHDKAICVFREKAKLDATVTFSITGFGHSKYALAGGFGFAVHGVISEPIRCYYKETHANLGKAYWDGAEPSTGLDSFIFLAADNKAKTYSLEFTYRLFPSGNDMVPFSVNGLRFESDDYCLYQDGPTKEGVTKTIHDNVSELDMRFFHDKAMGVFREKVKLDAKVAFSITEFNASGISGFFVNGVISEPITRYDWARYDLGWAFWDGADPGSGLGASVSLFVTDKMSYGLEFSYIPGKHNYPYPDLDTVPLSLRNILPSRAVWDGLPSGEDMVPFSVNGLRFESEKYSSDPPDAFGAS